MNKQKLMERDDEGKFTKKVTDKELINTIKNQDLPSTTDIAKKVGMDQSNAYRRLKKLEEQNKVKSEKIGQTLIWKTTNKN